MTRSLESRIEWNSTEEQSEPQYTECKRCHGLGVDKDDTDCVPCMGTGEIELR